MKIDKAIKNLTAGRKDCGMIPGEEYTQTIDLAIAALKRVKSLRLHGLPDRYSILPGETE